MKGPVLARLDHVPAVGEGPLRCRVNGEEVGLFRVGEQVKAWRDLCPHEAAPVCRGVVAGTRLESAVGDYQFGRAREILRCPWHGWEFDLLTGNHLASGSGARLRSHPIEVHDGLVFDAARLAHDRELLIKERYNPAEGVIVLDLTPVDDAPLPAWAPGAHLDLELASGRRRQYSLCGDPRDRTSYRVAVLREDGGRGGSVELHDDGHIGTRLIMRRIRNRFPLIWAPRYVFIAGGIGITAMLAMARSVARRNGSAELVYVGQSVETMPFRDEVAALGFARTIMTEREGRPDLPALLAETGDETVIYCCGPGEMIKDVAAAGERIGRRVMTESFTAVPLPVHGGAQENRAFDVVLARSGQRLGVGPGETIIQALRREGISHSASSCEQGWCGSCETQVLDGTPEHRDTVLTDEEREESDRMMICVGRTTDACLTLDL